MCELFGLSSKEKIYSGRMLKEFLSHASDNPHGWGVAGFDGGRATVIKEPESAAESSIAEELIQAEISTDLEIAHIRFATKGSISIENTHPFTMTDKSGMEWVLAHNGTVFDCSALSGYVQRQKGETDSERIMMYLIDSLNSRMRSDDEPLTGSERISVVEDVIREITPENKVNLILSDGNFLYAHMNYRGSLNVLDRDGKVIISTKPLQSAVYCDRVVTNDQSITVDQAAGCSGAAEWKELPLNTLMVYERGQLLYRSAAHDNEYIEDEDRIKTLYMDYAYM